VVGAFVLILAACGGDSGVRVGDSRGDPPVINVGDFQERAGAACSRFFGEVVREIFGGRDLAAEEVAPQTEQEMANRALELADELTSELRSIGAPEGQIDEWTEWIALLEESIDELREDPFADESNPEREDRIDGLGQELGVPKRIGDEPPGLDEELAATAAASAAEAVRSESGGVITQSEADCIADG
jgi:hypothetical protein